MGRKRQNFRMKDRQKYKNYRTIEDKIKYIQWLGMWMEGTQDKLDELLYHLHRQHEAQQLQVHG